jgi:predicted ATPase with chaperone activity
VKQCTRGPSMITRYGKRISAPLLGRMEIPIEVTSVRYGRLTDEPQDEPSAPGRPHGHKV